MAKKTKPRLWRYEVHFPIINAMTGKRVGMDLSVPVARASTRADAIERAAKKAHRLGLALALDDAEVIYA